MLKKYGKCVGQYDENWEITAGGKVREQLLSFFINNYYPAEQIMINQSSLISYWFGNETPIPLTLIKLCIHENSLFCFCFLEYMLDNSVKVFPCVSGNISMAMIHTRPQIPLWIQNIFGNPRRLTQAGKIFNVTEITLNFKQRMIEVATLLIFSGMISPRSEAGTAPTPSPYPRLTAKTQIGKSTCPIWFCNSDSLSWKN